MGSWRARGRTYCITSLKSLGRCPSSDCCYRNIISTVVRENSTSLYMYTASQYSCTQPHSNTHVHSHTPILMYTATLQYLCTQSHSNTHVHSHTPIFMYTATLQYSCTQPHSNTHVHSHTQILMYTATLQHNLTGPTVLQWGNSLVITLVPRRITVRILAESIISYCG